MSIVFAFFVALIVLKPFLGAQEHQVAPPVTSSLQSLLDQKNRSVQIIKDLELDFATSKLTEEDYSRMKAAISQELATILKKIDEHGTT